MQAFGRPDPFPVQEGFQIEVEGGHPPYRYDPAPAPPNPPGVEVTPEGRVSVPLETLPGTLILVLVADSSMPPQHATARARVAGGK